MTGSGSAFVISWGQTSIDGLRSPPVAALETGSVWRWGGEAVEVGPGSALRDRRVSVFCHGTASVIRHLVGTALPPVRPLAGALYGDAEAMRSFLVSDGRLVYRITLIEVPEVARPLLMFDEFVPPAEVPLRVVEGPYSPPVPAPVAGDPTGVICFTEGTVLRTPGGPRRVEDLREGDRLDTKDSGPQEILWIGRRRIAAARLEALPGLRPVRIREGALGEGEPTGDLIVSPRHRVLLTGRAARDLFGTSEVLVAAEDLLNDRSIVRDRSADGVTYIHILLPRHHVVWANGIETESFHPASTDLDTVDPEELRRLTALLPGIERDPRSYGGSARLALAPQDARRLSRERALGH